MTDLIRFVKRLVEVLEARDPAGVHRPLSVADLRETVFPYRTQRSSLGLTSAEDYDLLVLRLVAEEDDFVRTYPPESAGRARDEAGQINPNLDLVEELGEATIQIGATALARIQALVEEVETPGLEFLDVADALGVSATPPPNPVAHGPERVPEHAPSGPAPAPVVATSFSVRDPEPELADFEPIAETIDIDVEPVLAPVLPVEPIPPAIPVPPPVPPPLTCRACHATLPDRRAIMFCPFCGQRQGAATCARCGTELELGWRHCVECGQAVPGTERLV